MSSNAGIPIYGQLSDNHTSSLNAQYAPNNIPTPWPLLTLSVILSFLIGLLAIVPAMKSLDTQSAPALAPIPLQPTTAGASGSKTKTSKLSRAPKKPTMWLIYYITASYCTFRAISALLVTVKSYRDNTTPLPAPSSILLAQIATQIVHCNVGHHPLTRLILLLSIFALAITFGFCGYLPGKAAWARYGTLKLAGGNCPVTASDCMTQASSWISVGCDKWTTQLWSDTGSYAGWPQLFNIPYANGGDVNSNNALNSTEAGVTVIGTLWWPFVIAQLLDIFNIIHDLFHPGYSATATTGTTRQVAIWTGVQTVLSPFHPKRLFASRRCKVDSDVQRAMYYWIIGAGTAVALLVMLMGIGGHTYQMMNKQETTYLDSFGPPVGTNLTFNTQGVLTSTNYLGNATSWCDCFLVRAPGSRSGFWSAWVKQNSHSGSLYRIAGGF